MFTILKNECKSIWKSLIIWALAVGGMGLMCIILFKSMEADMADMAENYANMGAFSDVFGMSTLSIATLKGFFATEVGTIHALGGSMFAASIASVILSKEEDQHTAEFTFALPLSRLKIIIMKFVAVLFNILLFTIICGSLYLIGFVFLGEQDIVADFVKYMLFQLIMNIEVAGLCFVISSVSKKNKLGIGISLAMLLYVIDLMSRAIPDLKDINFLSPFSYANAANIFSGTKLDTLAMVTGVIVIFLTFIISSTVYNKRDLAS